MSFSARQTWTFAITWVAYAGFYLCRKNLSIVLPALPWAAGGADLRLAHIVFGYSLMYAVGQFGWGFLSDYAGAKRVVGAGLLLAVAGNLLMGVHDGWIWLLVFACLNGIGQATGWSGLVKIMASWFSGADRGIVMAWWGTNYVLGGFLATAFATWSITQRLLLPALGWRRGFFFPAVLLLAITVWLFQGVQEAPEPTSANTPEPVEVQHAADRSDWSDLLGLLRTPSLWYISVSYFFLEMCRYALMFWLPFYLVSRLKYTLQVSGYVSSLYELVGIVGAVLAGYISDRFNQSRRAPVSVAMLAGLGAVMFAQPALAHWGLWGVALGISLAGVLSFGPDTLLSGAGAQDVGDVRAAATASGLIDGIGHLGAILSPYVVYFVSRRYGWDRLFLVLAASAVAAAAVLLPIWDLRPPDRELPAKAEDAFAHSA